MPHFQRTPGIQNQVSNVKSKSNAFAREPWSSLFLATCKTCLTMSESWPSIEINDTIRTRTRTAFRFRSALWLCSTVQPNKTKKWRKMRKAQRVVIRFLMPFGTCDLASCNFCLRQKHHQSQTKIIYNDPSITISIQQYLSNINEASTELQPSMAPCYPSIELEKKLRTTHHRSSLLHPSRNLQVGFTMDLPVDLVVLSGSYLRIHCYSFDSFDMAAMATCRRQGSESPWFRCSVESEAAF